MLQDWRVGNGTDEIIIEAESWVGALSVGLPALGIDLGALGRLACTVLEDGGVIARDPTSGAEIRVEPLRAGPPLTMPAPSIGDADPDVDEPSICAPPIEDMPRAHAAGEPPSPEAESAALDDDAVMDLFLRLGELSSSTGVADASSVALRILLDLVPAGASAVLIRTRSGDGLRFRAASGPAARKLVDSVIPLDQGIAGYVCQLGVGLLIGDVRRDSRHSGRVDRSTGYTTRAMIAVPVRADSGAVFGCLELLNPPTEFSGQDFEIAARVAASLGAFLASVDAVR